MEFKYRELLLISFIPDLSFITQEVYKFNFHLLIGNAAANQINDAKDCDLPWEISYTLRSSDLQIYCTTSMHDLMNYQTLAKNNFVHLLYTI